VLEVLFSLRLFSTACVSASINSIHATAACVRGSMQNFSKKIFYRTDIRNKGDSKRNLRFILGEKSWNVKWIELAQEHVQLWVLLLSAFCFRDSAVMRLIAC
jgi:hypothetical protein